jgi:hypothetical protein
LSSQQELGKFSRGLAIGQSAGEKFAAMTPINNVHWSYFRINRLKTVIVNVKKLEPLNFFNHQWFLSCPRSIKPYLKSTLKISWDCPFNLDDWKRIGVTGVT